MLTRFTLYCPLSGKSLQKKNVTTKKSIAPPLKKDRIYFMNI